MFNKFEYHLEDCDCQYCVHSKGRKSGCKRSKCLYADIKQAATVNGRIKRKERILIKEYLI
jgi:hypothetical protein